MRPPLLPKVGRGGRHWSFGRVVPRATQTYYVTASADRNKLNSDVRVDVTPFGGTTIGPSRSDGPDPQSRELVRRRAAC